MPVLDEKSLAGDQNWQRSRFGELEAFMVDFLVGGASAGESLRLKLQTPLFVSDALLEAARQQLAAELSAAEQVRVLIPKLLIYSGIRNQGSLQDWVAVLRGAKQPCSMP